MIVSKPGPMTLLLLWALISAGMLTGASVGYQAEDPANATVSYDADTKELTVGNETSVVYGPDAEVNEYENETPVPLSDTGERWFGPNADPTESPWIDAESANETFEGDILPAPVGDHLEQSLNTSVNRTLDTGFEIMADAGNVAAQTSYRYQDHVSLATVQVVVGAIAFSPLVGGAAVLFKKIGSE